MKKLFLMATLVAAFMLSSCSKTPKPILQIADEFRTEMAEQSDEGMAFQSVELEDHAIVITAELDESSFEGMSFKDAFAIVGVDEEFLTNEMKKNFFEDLDEQDKEQIEALRKYQYDIVFRFVGSESKDVMEAKLSYEDLPKF